MSLCCKCRGVSRVGQRTCGGCHARLMRGYRWLKRERVAQARALADRIDRDVLAAVYPVSYGRKGEA